EVWSVRGQVGDKIHLGQTEDRALNLRLCDARVSNGRCSQLRSLAMETGLIASGGYDREQRALSASTARMSECQAWVLLPRAYPDLDLCDVLEGSDDLDDRCPHRWE